MGRFFNMRNGSTPLNIFLRFVLPRQFEKNWADKLAMNSEIRKYPSTLRKSGAMRYKHINGGQLSARLIRGFLMQ